LNKTVTLQPRRYGAVNWLGFRTLLAREIMRFLKVSAQTLVAPLVSTILFMAVFSLALGHNGSPFPGVRYVDFLAPGLLMMAILNNAFANSSSSLLIAKVQGNSVDFLMPPLSAAELAAAFLAGAAARGILVGLIGAAILAPFAHIAPKEPLAAIFFGVTASVLFAAIGLLAGIWAEKFDHIAAVTNFVVTPLTFLSGTFYSIDRLPPPFAQIGHMNPVFFLIDGFRYGFTGHADGNLAIGASVTAALAVALCIACWLLLRAGYRLKA
jgi:ABC-2 type transport system permease protein